MAGVDGCLPDGQLRALLPTGVPLNTAVGAEPGTAALTDYPHSEVMSTLRVDEGDDRRDMEAALVNVAPSWTRCAAWRSGTGRSSAPWWPRSTTSAVSSSGSCASTASASTTPSRTSTTVRAPT